MTPILNKSYLQMSEVDRSIHKVLFIAGLLSLCSYGYLLIQSQSYGDASLQDLWLASGLCNVINFFLFFYLWKQKSCSPITLILLFAIAFRLVGLATFPILEDDFYRYLWDGYSVIEHGNPYIQPPSASFDQTNLGERFDEILDSINYPNIPTVYGPVLQWVFGISAWIAPGELWPVKIFIFIADIAVLLLLIRLFKNDVSKIPFLLLYAWNPLIIKEFVISAHPDIIGVAFLMFGIVAAQKRFIYPAAMLFALAAASKIFAIILIPFILKFNWRAWSVFFVSCLIVALPFGIVDAWLPKGLQVMANLWLFNAPLYTLFLPILEFNTIKLILLSCFTCGLAVYYFYFLRNKCTPLKVRGDYLYGALLLCISVLNPWYVVWLLPFAVTSSAIWPSVAAATILLLGYASGINTGNESGLYDQSNVTLLVQFGMIVCVLFTELALSWKRKNE